MGTDTSVEATVDASAEASRVCSRTQVRNPTAVAAKATKQGADGKQIRLARGTAGTFARQMPPRYAEARQQLELT